MAGHRSIIVVAAIVSAGSAAAIVALDEDIRRSDEFTVIESADDGLGGIVTDERESAVVGGSDADGVDGAEPDGVDGSHTSVGSTNDTESQASGTVVISEISYHPSDADAVGEFVELLNPGPGRADVGGWCIRGFRRCLDENATLEPGDVLVVGAVASEGGGRLDNGGETLELIDRSGAIVDAVTYATDGRWPAIADGTGASLHRRDSGASSSLPGNWDAAEPTPGVVEASAPVRPTWYEVALERSPAPGAPLRLGARVAGVDAARATVVWRVGFGEERSQRVIVADDGTIDFDVPGARAGEIVRVRLEAESADGVVGSWPRSGDGTRYIGTMVEDPSVRSDSIGTLHWFMEDDAFAAAIDDRLATGDDGRVAVVVIDGQLIDNVLVRVKGGSSRFFAKPKWKFTLPAGHELSIPVPSPASTTFGVGDRLVVDEFAIHSSWNDKSFVREVLSHEAFASSDIPITTTFPLEVTLGGEFFGLFVFVEQPDGRWRERVGLDDAAVWEVGSEESGFVSAEDATIDDGVFARRYQREHGDADAERTLRALIGELHDRLAADDPVRLRDWVIAALDVPAFVEVLAISSIIQHQDYASKNYRLVLADGRISVAPFDLEYTWGRTWESDCEWACEDVVAEPLGVVAPGFFAPFVVDAALAEMVALRVDELTTSAMDVDRVRRRVADLVALMDESARRDRERWGTYGSPASMADEAQRLIDEFVVPQATALADRLGARSARVDESPAEVSLTTSESDGVMRLVVANESPRSVDVSGWRIEPIGVVIRPGSVLAEGRSGDIVDPSGASWSANDRMVIGTWDADDWAGETLRLLDPDGEVRATR